jgi:N-acetylglutamate synthase
VPDLHRGRQQSDAAASGQAPPARAMIQFDWLVHQAWPAVEVVEHDGWVFRSAGGVTKRANSVWPAAEAADPEAAIKAAEKFYATRDLPTVFSLSDDLALDGLLARCGYEQLDPTVLMVRELDDGPAVEEDVEIAEHPSEAWMRTWWSVDGRHADRATARTIITGVPADYASLGGGVGRGVPQEGWYGIYCMAVLPEARRQGLARKVLHALLHRAAERSASRAYLCVTERNAAALALYRSAKFRPAGRYHYRIKG